MQTVGANGIPFAIVFTKTDKISKLQVENNTNKFKDAMLEHFEFLPECFYTSAETEFGKEEVLDFINKTIVTYNNRSESAY